MTPLNPAKDWPDGQLYLNRCVHCNELFSGHKRRIECKECVKNLCCHQTMIEGFRCEGCPHTKQGDILIPRRT